MGWDSFSWKSQNQPEWSCIVVSGLIAMFYFWSYSKPSCFFALFAQHLWLCLEVCLSTGHGLRSESCNCLPADLKKAVPRGHRDVHTWAWFKAECSRHSERGAKSLGRTEEGERNSGGGGSLLKQVAFKLGLERWVGFQQADVGWGRGEQSREQEEHRRMQCCSK